MLRTTLVAALLLITVDASAQAARNGRNFDPGASMTARSDGAPAELDRMGFMLGDWRVERTAFEDDGTSVSATGRSTVTFMNRGHAIMEAFYTVGSDAGPERSSLSFLAYNPGAEQWIWGEADSYTESVRMANGGFVDDRLILRDAVRRDGRVLLTDLRYTLSKTENGFQLALDESTDGGKSWQRRLVKSYAAYDGDEPSAATGEGFGSPAPGLPVEAREFDFLIGTWAANHDLRLPNGQNPRWTSTSTARYALNGHAILEFNWFDVDPTLPDAATTILRVYNRAMRRWECLYASNRGNGLLSFGGRKEGDEMVLHLFAHDRGAAQIARYVFHDIRENSYGWYSELSQDGGASFAKNWIIEVARTQLPEGGADAPLGN